jgi:hypothetical protein
MQVTKGQGDPLRRDAPKTSKRLLDKRKRANVA